MVTKDVLFFITLKPLNIKPHDITHDRYGQGAATNLVCP